MQDELWVYQVPLLFFSSHFEAHEDERLLSHLDFKDLLFNELAAGSVPVDDNRFVMIVGPTGMGFRTFIQDEGSFTLVKERAGLRIALSDEKGKRTSSLGRVSPAVLLRLFDDYRSAFDRHAR